MCVQQSSKSNNYTLSVHQSSKSNNYTLCVQQSPKNNNHTQHSSHNNNQTQSPNKGDQKRSTKVAHVSGDTTVQARLTDSN